MLITKERKGTAGPKHGLLVHRCIMIAQTKFLYVKKAAGNQSQPFDDHRVDIHHQTPIREVSICPPSATDT
jgi:hypothetical protein